MSELVTCQIENQVATIVMQNGKVNAISHQVIDELNQAEQTKAVVVLTGQAGIFSAGYDLTDMNDSKAAAMALSEKGSILAIRMLSFPYPLTTELALMAHLKLT